MFVRIHFTDELSNGGTNMTWQEALKSLWIERLIWVRQLLLGIILGLRDVRYVIQRIRRNSAEYGQILGNLYGFEMGRRFEYFITQYITTLSEIASTIKTGQDIQLLLQQWEQIIVDIANLLSQTNPYWTFDAIYALVKNQSQMELEFVTMLQNSQYSEAIMNFDKSYDNAMYAGDLMVYGIERQFGI